MGTDTLVSVNIIVSGRVQGVHYRRFTREHALRLGLTGFVRNLPDGRVELLAEGPRESIDELIAMLHKGPSFARVETVDVRWNALSGDYPDFRIQQ